MFYTVICLQAKNILILDASVIATLLFIPAFKIPSPLPA